MVRANAGQPSENFLKTTLPTFFPLPHNWLINRSVKVSQASERGKSKIPLTPDWQLRGFANRTRRYDTLGSRLQIFQTNGPALPLAVVVVLLLLLLSKLTRGRPDFS